MSVNLLSTTVDATGMVEAALKQLFGKIADVERHYSIQYAVDTLVMRDKPLLAVFPTDRKITAIHRNEEIENTFTVDVAVLKKIKKPVPEEIDQHIGLSERIIDAFVQKRTKFNNIGFMCKKAEHLFIFCDETMFHNVFQGVVRLSIDCNSRIVRANSGQDKG